MSFTLAGVKAAVGEDRPILSRGRPAAGPAERVISRAPWVGERVMPVVWDLSDILLMRIGAPTDSYFGYESLYPFSRLQPRGRGRPPIARMFRCQAGVRLGQGIELRWRIGTVWGCQ